MKQTNKRTATQRPHAHTHTHKKHDNNTPKKWTQNFDFFFIFRKKKKKKERRRNIQKKTNKNKTKRLKLHLLAYCQRTNDVCMQTEICSTTPVSDIVPWQTTAHDCLCFLELFFYLIKLFLGGKNKPERT